MRETDRAMHVAHVITGLNTGGAEMFLCRLLETMRPPHFKHTVICLLDEGPLSSRVAAVADLYHLGMRRSHFRLAGLWRLRRILRNCGPDLIQAWMYHANFISTLAAFRMNMPVIWGVRQSLYDVRHERKNTQLVIRASRLLSGRAVRIVYNSSTGRRQHEAFGFDAACGLVIPNGFDTEQIRPDALARARIRAELQIKPDDLAVGLIARWHPMKDHDSFLQASALFVRTYSRVVFVLVGEGLDDRNEVLMSWIRDRSLTEQVRLCGRRGDVPSIDAALDIAVSSSAWGEGFSNAIGEAMACGVPCVATGVGENYEIIGDTGIVVPPNDPQALCAGWEKLAAMDSTQRILLGLAARRRICDRYSLDAVARCYADMYTNVVERSPPD